MNAHSLKVFRLLGWPVALQEEEFTLSCHSEQCPAFKTYKKQGNRARQERAKVMEYKKKRLEFLWMFL